MVSKKLEESILEAKEALDNIETLGATAFDICDGILSNNKAFIHDPKVYDEVMQKEKQVYLEYSKQINEARLKLKNVDPFYQWGDGLEFYMKLRRWKSMELLNYWDKISKKEQL